MQWEALRAGLCVSTQNAAPGSQLLHRSAAGTGTVGTRWRAWERSHVCAGRSRCPGASPHAALLEAQMPGTQVGNTTALPNVARFNIFKKGFQGDRVEPTLHYWK